MNKQTKGSCAELLAAAALTRSDYQVYLNPVNSGDADLVVIKDGVVFTVQVKAFYDKQGYTVAEMRTSNRAGGKYHESYADLVDLMALVDTDTGEVFLVDPSARKTQIHKSQVLTHQIFPV